MMKPSVEELKNIAITLRKTSLEMIYTAQSGHPGGSLCCRSYGCTLF